MGERARRGSVVTVGLIARRLSINGPAGSGGGDADGDGEQLLMPTDKLRTLYQLEKRTQFAEVRAAPPTGEAAHRAGPGGHGEGPGAPSPPENR